MSRLVADLNGNGRIDPGDFAYWVRFYNGGDPRADQDQDGDLDQDDFQAFIANYGLGDDGPTYGTGNWVTAIPQDIEAFDPVYCSSSEGDDDNDGTKGSPVASIARAIQIANRGEQAVALKGGDTFRDRIRNFDYATGNTDSYFGVYGEGRARVISTTNSLWSNNINSKPMRRLVVWGIDFEPAQKGTGTGLAWLKSGTEGVIFEDCGFRNFKGAIVINTDKNQPFQRDIAFRRCVIEDNQDIGGKSSGVYLERTKGVVFDECIIARSGTRNTLGHGVYAQKLGRSRDTMFYSCIFVDDPSSPVMATGVQHRSGGQIIGCVFAGNPAGVLMALGGTIEGNLITDMTDITPELRRGHGILLGNAPEPVVVRDNLIGNNIGRGTSSIGIRFHDVNSWVKSATITGNYISDVDYPIITQARPTPPADTRVTIVGNHINTDGRREDNLFGSGADAYNSGKGTDLGRTVNVSGNFSWSGRVPGMEDIEPGFYRNVKENPRAYFGRAGEFIEKAKQIAGISEV